ncbi:SGNH/GDSL hydrolase family protein [Butyrivibrio sp. AD3002]|uniref:SGNH/GDSL hydrolase family protein n=1 Tax=Butyrivibrio sp. AD3002 TaxID=1280670 RepID=UPI0003B684A2|nr:SGNH/GDSL hydrolase family protein [Butyrivibrio sp. AD3002]
MRKFMFKQLKTALVLLCAMLIFLQMIPCAKPVKVYAAEEEEEECEVEEIEQGEEDDVEEDEEDDDDGEEISLEEVEKKSEGENAKKQESQQNKTTGKQENSQKQAESGKQEGQSETVLKQAPKGRQKKLTVELPAEKPRYYDKVAIGEEIKIVVKSKGKKINNKYLKFSSNKKSVASVNNAGIITANKYGTANVKVVYKTKKKKTYKCNIYVTVAKSTVRTLYVGDSRSVDLFSATAESVFGEVHNDIVVCALNGANVRFLGEVLDHSDLSDYDMIITWMGANDFGHFKPYIVKYNRLVSKGKKLVVCSVGMTRDAFLDEGGQPLFNTGVINRFNIQLMDWAGKKKKVKTVSMNDYIANKVSIDSKDGVHYSPKPNKGLWNYILDKAE